MLLFPLISAMVLTRRWDWGLLPAAAAAVAVFLIREPLLVLARQRYVWKETRPETLSARRSLLVFGIVLAAAGAWLAGVVSVAWLLGLGLAAGALTAVAIYGALHNRQRSALLQIAGAVGLASSALLPYLAEGLAPDVRLWLLIGTHVVHSTGAVLVVHARLDAARALKTGAAIPFQPVAAVLWLVMHGLAAGALALAGVPWLGLVLAIPLAVHAVDLARLRDAGFLHTPLRQVGFRELALSSVFSLLVVAVLF